MTDSSASPATPDTGAAPAAPASAPSTPAPAASPEAPAAPAAVSAPSGDQATTKAPAAPTDGQPAPKPADPAAPVDGQPKPADAPDAFKVPDEYKDKPWAGKVKTQDDLWKQLANAQELIGKKSVVPDLAKATPEEREAYYAQLRPKDASEYKFVETIPVEDSVKGTVTEMFMKNGISATQGNEIIKGYQELGEKMMAAQFDADGFKSSMETAFGKDWEKVTGHTRNTIKGMMSAEDQTILDHLPNSYLGVIYRTLGNVVKAYGVKETDQAHLQGGGGHAPTDIASVRQSLRDQMASMSGRPHTAQEMMELRTKLADTYKNDPRLAQQG